MSIPLRLSAITTKRETAIASMCTLSEHREVVSICKLSITSYISIHAKSASLLNQGVMKCVHVFMVRSPLRSFEHLARKSRGTRK
jgi:hypothetical protein